MRNESSIIIGLDKLVVELINKTSGGKLHIMKINFKFMLVCVHYKSIEIISP